MKRPSTSLVVALAMSACVRPEGVPPTTDPVRYDSLGISVVANSAAAADFPLAWSLSEEPSLVIGSGSDPNHQLFGVEDALRFPDGRIAVADGGSSQIRIYDARGEYVGAWGRDGEGPGEFTGLTNLELWPGDSLMAWDFLQNRMTVFDSAGQAGRTQRLTLGEGLGAARYEGVLDDGSMIVASLISFSRDDRATGLVRRSRAFSRVNVSGEQVADFGEFPDEEYYVRAETGAVLRHPFRRAVHSVVWGGRVIISASDQYCIAAFDPAGGVEMIIRTEHTPEPVTAAAIDSYVAARIAGAAEDEQSLVAAIFAGLPPVPSYPAFSALVVDEVGDLWVRSYARDPGPRSSWAVFAPDGALRGSLDLPTQVDVYRIGADYVLGRIQDDLGVERVQLWELSRGDP